MPFVLVDAPGITVTLITTGAPQPVQIVITGLTPGLHITVQGTTAAGDVWAVPGGDLDVTGTQVVLIDNRGPLNVPIVYQVLIEGVAYESDPITVPFPDQYLLQSLDGRQVVRFRWRDNGLPGEPTMQSVAFDVPGRRRPPVRFAPGGEGGGELDIRVDRANGAVLRDLLLTGQPLVIRTDGQVRDFPTVEIIQPMRVPNRLWIAATHAGKSTDRVWTISYLLIDDPEPSTPMSGWTWDDFDEAMAASTWDDFDDLFATSTWDDFDAYDWGQLL